ncbi:hypothetical protein [Nocardia tengchongensis]|uniref:hypothetical protein n=1 Tax=Nocardia tengchongensis TaxID=2055889 RepID=UPI0036061157
MRSIAVGQLYDPRRRRWAPMPVARITHAGIHLVLNVADPTAVELEAVQTGEPRFAWVDAPHVALLAWSFGEAIPWTDVPYSPHLEDSGDVPGIGDKPGTPTTVTVVLVDADTGVVRAVRETPWPPEFAAVVRDSIARMAAEPVDMNAIEAAMATLYVTYPDTAELVAWKANAVCADGHLMAS